METIAANPVKVYIRHAESKANRAAQDLPPEERRVGGYQPNIPLSDTGIRQAYELGRILRPQLEQMIGAFTVVRFAVAPARRTTDTGLGVYAAMSDIAVPVTVRRNAHELRKGYKLFGGDEKRRRAAVETPEYQKALRTDWEFRAGRPLANKLGLYVLHRAERLRQGGGRIRDWYQELPDMAEVKVPEGHRAVDILVSHGIVGYLGLGRLLHADPSGRTASLLTPDQAHAAYEMKNAEATIVDRNAHGLLHIRGTIIPDVVADTTPDMN